VYACRYMYGIDSREPAKEPAATSATFVKSLHDLYICDCRLSHSTLTSIYSSTCRAGMHEIERLECETVRQRQFRYVYSLTYGKRGAAKASDHLRATSPRSPRTSRTFVHCAQTEDPGSRGAQGVPGQEEDRV
jgi:hypothetical protein